MERKANGFVNFSTQSRVEVGEYLFEFFERLLTTIQKGNMVWIEVVGLMRHTHFIQIQMGSQQEESKRI